MRDLAVVVGLVLAPWCWVVANTCYLLAIRHGGSDEDGAGTLALAAAHPGLLRAAYVAVMVGGILVVPAVLGFWRLAGDRLAVVIGGGLMAIGYICYAGVGAQGLLQLAMAGQGGPVEGFAKAIDAANADPAAVWAFLLFVAGNLVGTLVLAIGLWRAHVAPVWVPLALISWPVLHVGGLALLGNEVPQVVGAVLQATAFAMYAVLVLRRGRMAQAPLADRAGTEPAVPATA